MNPAPGFRNYPEHRVEAPEARADPLGRNRVVDLRGLGAADLLGRGVGQRAQELARRGQAPRVERQRRAEVEHAHAPGAAAVRIVGNHEILKRFVIREAYANALRAAKWPDGLRVAVNVSSLQFKNSDLVAVISECLAEAGIPARRLEIEITESLLLERGNETLEKLQKLRALGINIAMDDFGTGYSSLSYLRSFPFDRIKIDRSFVRDLATNRDSQAIVRAILTLGSSLGITITAEGIETEAELAWLRAEGCAEGQGYLFGRAQPQAETLVLLAAESMLHVAA